MSKEPEGPISTVDLTSPITARILAVITAAILFQVGSVIFHLLNPLGNLVRVGVLFAVYAMAFVLLIAAASNIDIEIWGGRLAYATLAIFLAAVSIAYFSNTAGRIGTDGLLFARYSVDLLLEGKNPYAHSMLPAFDEYPIREEYVTYKIDGNIVTSLSYPALSVLVFLPQALLGIPNLNLTSVFVILLVLLFLIRESPTYLKFAPFAVLFTDPSLIAFSFGGVFDIIWVFPLLIAMKFWYVGRIRAAAFAVGLACAVKQTPWFITPFLAIWLYERSEDVEEFLQVAIRCIGYGLAGFLLPNLPFIVWDFRAWIDGVLTPIAGGGVPLVKQGAGLTMLSVANMYPLPKSFFTLSMFIAIIVLLIGYSLYFNRVKWMVWLVPAVVLWFNYRSLQNYFVFFIPIAYYSALLQCNLVEKESREGISMVGVTQGPLWKPSQLHPSLRNKMMACLILLAVATTGVAAVTMQESSQLDASVEIVGGEDPDELQSVSVITVEVTNHEERPIEPTFSIIHENHHTNAYWDIMSGPDRLAPGESGRYTIKTPAATLAVPYDTEFILGVNDRGTEIMTREGPQSFSGPAYTRALNPYLRWWSIQPGGEQKHPYLWHTTRSAEKSDTVSYERVGDDRVRVAADGVSRESGPWAMGGLIQEVPFPETVTVTATPETVVDEPVKHPKAVSGVELGENNHRIWIVYGNVSQQTTVYRNSGDLMYALVYVPATPGEEVTTTIDVAQIYEERGWRSPSKRVINHNGETIQQRRMHVLAFAAVYPNQPDEQAEVVFDRIETAKEEPGSQTVALND